MAGGGAKGSNPVNWNPKRGPKSQAAYLVFVNFGLLVIEVIFGYCEEN
tara:strand:+ start:393 stop:536 length:144 start_codon:yes stop_codon:yes gene_type:complete